MSEKQSREWPDQGTEPPVGAEAIEGEEEYPSPWMNWALWALTTDVDTLFDETDSLESDLETTESELSDDIETTESELSSDIQDVIDDLDAHSSSTSTHGADEGEHLALTPREDQAVAYTDVVEREHGMGDHDGSVASSDDVDAVAGNLDTHTSDSDDPHETLPIETNDLSDEAVTAAKLAAAAVESGAIASDAVGQDEIASDSVGREQLLEALGTSEGSPITGTTHFEGASIERATIENTAIKLSNDSENTSVENDTIVQIEWDTVEFEHTDIFESDLDNDEITILEDGTYLIDCTIRYDDSSDWSTGDEVEMFLATNGSFRERSLQNKTGNGNQTFHLSTIRELTSGSTIDISTRQISGEDQAIASNNIYNYLSIGRLG